jgi:hypothetical protein
MGSSKKHKSDKSKESRKRKHRSRSRSTERASRTEQPDKAERDREKHRHSKKHHKERKRDKRSPSARDRNGVYSSRHVRAEDSGSDGKFHGYIFGNWGRGDIKIKYVCTVHSSMVKDPIMERLKKGP